MLRTILFLLATLAYATIYASEIEISPKPGTYSSLDAVTITFSSDYELRLPSDLNEVKVYKEDVLFCAISKMSLIDSYVGPDFNVSHHAFKMTFAQPLTDIGNYSVRIPSGIIGLIDKEQNFSYYNEPITIDYYIRGYGNHMDYENGFKITPEPGEITSLEAIYIDFSDNDVQWIMDTSFMDISKDGEFYTSVYCKEDTQDPWRLEIILNKLADKAGTYKLTIPANKIPIIVDGYCMFFKEEINIEYTIREDAGIFDISMEDNSANLIGNFDTYNMQGMLVGKNLTPQQRNLLPKGIYIINGKKFVIN